MTTFAAPTNRAPAFGGVRAAPGQKYAVEWVKKRLRSIHRDARAAGRASPLNEPAAHLYLLVATYVLDGRFISEPIPVQDLVGVMHCESISVRRARKRLTALGDLRLIDGGQGKAYVKFALVKMAGPLYAEKGGAAAASGAPTSIPESEVGDAHPRSQRSKYAATSISQSEVVDAELRSQSPKFAPTSIPEIEVAADDYMYLEEEDPSSTGPAGDAGARSAHRTGEPIIDDSMTANEQRAALDAAVAETDELVDYFCHWWLVTYPAHNDGVQNRVRECDRKAAFTLLCDRSVELVQAMAIEMWATTSDGHNGSDRWFIASGDRSICVLLQKATHLDREVRRLDRLATQQVQRRPWSPDEKLAAHVGRVLVRLRQAIADPSTSSLTELLSGIAEELSTFDFSDRRRAAARLEILDVEILQAARAAFGDDKQLQAEADSELAQFRGGMLPEAYERARLAAINRLVRERLHIPVLVWELAAAWATEQTG